MVASGPRTFCWSPLWNPAHPGVGLELLVLTDRSADSVILAIDEDEGPFRLSYRLVWDEHWQIREADLTTTIGADRRSLSLRTDGDGQWALADGETLPELDGCRDIDIWPTPFTNSFPICRSPFAVGERRDYTMAWIAAPALTVRPVPQAYTRLGDRRYLFENLDGSGFSAELTTDGEGLVIDYPGLFRRVTPA